MMPIDIPNRTEVQQESPLSIAHLIDDLHLEAFFNDKVMLAEALSDRLKVASLSDIICDKPDALEVIAKSSNSGFISPLEAITPSLQSLPDSTLVALSPDTLYQLALSASHPNLLYRNQCALDNIANSLKKLSYHDLTQILMKSHARTFSAIIDAAVLGSADAFLAICETLFPFSTDHSCSILFSEEHESTIERIRENLNSRRLDIEKILTDSHRLIDPMPQSPPILDLPVDSVTTGMTTPNTAPEDNEPHLLFVMDAEETAGPHSTRPGFSRKMYAPPSSYSQVPANSFLPKALATESNCDEEHTHTWVPYVKSNLIDHSSKRLSAPKSQLTTRQTLPPAPPPSKPSLKRMSIDNCPGNPSYHNNLVRKICQESSNSWPPFGENSSIGRKIKSLPLLSLHLDDMEEDSNPFFIFPIDDDDVGYSGQGPQNK